MKTGKELGLEVIKCQNKTGTDALRLVHHEINEVLYKNMFRYIDQALAIDIYNTLCGYGKTLGEMDVPAGAKAKRDELIAELRKRCLILKDYKKITNTVEEVPQMQKVVNYFVHQCIKTKEEGINTEKALALLIESKRIYNAFVPFSEDLKLETLTSFNTELLNYFETTYGIRH